MLDTSQSALCILTHLILTVVACGRCYFYPYLTCERTEAETGLEACS